MNLPAPRILLVDDEPGMGRLVELSLRELRASVTQVADIAGAVRAAREHRPDIVLLDISLESEDGLDLLPLLREDETFGETPIVAFSVHDSREREARARGANGFVAKPFRATQLRTEVLRALEDGGG